MAADHSVNFLDARSLPCLTTDYSLQTSLLSQWINIIPRVTQAPVRREFLIVRHLGCDGYVLKIDILKIVSRISSYYEDLMGDLLRSRLDELAEYREKTPCVIIVGPQVNRRVPFVITYHPRLPNIGQILHRLHVLQLLSIVLRISRKDPW